MKVVERGRNDCIVVLIILVIGFLCVLAAGQLALRFAPGWRLNTNMDSLLDPNSDFLTHQPSGFIEAIDPSILTQPSWLNIFLTPDASFVTGTPFPIITRTRFASPGPTNISLATNTAIVAKSPTNTFVYIPPTWTAISNPASTSTSTRTPSSPFNPTNTPASTATATTTPTPTNAPLIADLQITKDDGVSVYTANGTLTYTVTVINYGPSNVVGAVIVDNIPSQITNWNWACTTQNGGATGCDVLNGNANFRDTVNLPSGASIVYVVTTTISPAGTGNLVNTASISLPAGYIDSNPANNVSTDTDSPAVDLQITKSDGVTTYTPGGTLIYTVIFTNNSTFDVNGATITDLFPSQISSSNWNCSPSAGATCTAGGAGNINDTVYIPAGLSITYTIMANVSSYAAGTLSNTASVTTPAGFTEVASGNNSATDSDASSVSEPDIGPPDDSWTSLAPGTSITIVLSPAIIADGDVGTPDFVYYERLAAPALTHIDLDWVQVEISADGSIWYQVFYWGDTGGSPDTNTNVDVQNLIGDLCPTEIDNCSIPDARLHNSSGITIDIDGIVPPGSYPWVRITSPASADPSEIDAIQPYYP